ncbi:hypothetical protein OIU74_006438 [Salix koriyanagi]|uniref:Uncharacterized protein n=1 Tax=Salix koriyanagi TaxID=2511006 RepID=A0A9Q0UE37_9ROSI|nr:hypothetical protein OIU74_006438 [Salix koriyanagi]
MDSEIIKLIEMIFNCFFYYVCTCIYLFIFVPLSIYSHPLPL